MSEDNPSLLLIADAFLCSWSSLPHYSMEALDISLPVPSMRVLNAHRDRLELQRRIPSLTTFQLAYRFVKLFCVRHCIYAARFGYLGGIHISILLCRVAETLPSSASSSLLVKSFFQTYASFDWSNEIARLSGTATTYRRSTREPVVILSPERPVVNVAANASVPTLQTMMEEFRSAHGRLTRGLGWSKVCGTKTSRITAFLDRFDLFVKIDVSYWGSSCMDARALLGFLESRVVNVSLAMHLSFKRLLANWLSFQLLVELHQAEPQAVIRLWPERFAESLPEPGSKSSNVHGLYLLGLQRALSPVDRRPLIGLLQIFEETIRKNDIYYDPTFSFVSVAECRRDALPSSVLVDRPAWSDDGIDDTADSEDEADELQEALETIDFQDRFTHQSNASIKKQQRSSKSSTTTHIPAQKLRTSTNVYNRLMWDPQLDQGDYLIGYEDRFLGIREMPLASWKREIEDEAFVRYLHPQYTRCSNLTE